MLVYEQIMDLLKNFPFEKLYQGETIFFWAAVILLGIGLLWIGYWNLSSSVTIAVSSALFFVDLFVNPSYNGELLALAAAIVSALIALYRFKRWHEYTEPGRRQRNYILRSR